MDYDITEAGKAVDGNTLYKIRHFQLQPDIHGVMQTMPASSEFWSREQLVELKLKLLNDMADIDAKLAEIDKLKE